MTDALSHRGPDDAGIESISLADGTEICLGHRRLSILDLSANGHQPMGDPRTGSWVVFNGEIYNHLDLRAQIPADFRSTCDTETLLRAWVERGPDAIRSLAGIFAFAIFDGRRQELWLVRDHLGVKPLYVAQPENDLWLFASDLRALLASGMVDKRLSIEGLSSYLAFGAVQAPWTMIASIRSLMPAEKWCFPLRDNSGSLTPRVSRYWNPADYFPQHRENTGAGTDSRALRTPAPNTSRLNGVWEKAVSSQMLSDVPVGVFLSGGIDSTAIVSTLARQGTVPKTFSVIFSEQAYDESQYSRQVAKQYATDHHEITITARQVLDNYAAITAAYDQPSIDGINTYVISKAIRDHGIKVAISGLGGDELFAGYPTFNRIPFLSRWLPLVPKHVARYALSLFTEATGTGRGLKLSKILDDEVSRFNIYYALRQLFAYDTRDRLMASGAPSCRGIDDTTMSGLSHRAEGLDAVNAVSLLEDVALHAQYVAAGHRPDVYGTWTGGPSTDFGSALGRRSGFSFRFYKDWSFWVPKKTAFGQARRHRTFEQHSPTPKDGLCFPLGGMAAPRPPTRNRRRLNGRRSRPKRGSESRSGRHDLATISEPDDYLASIGHSCPRSSDPLVEHPQGWCTRSERTTSYP